MTFALEKDTIEDVLILKPSGSLQTTSTDILKDYLDNLFRTKNFEMVIDMTQIEYINSLGIGVITWAHNRARKEGGKIVLAGLRPKILAIFQIAFLTSILNITETVEDAIDILIPK